MATPLAIETRAADRRAARVNRACIACRARKQRCIPPSANASSQSPCQRCVRHAITCSFETDTPADGDAIGPSQLSHIVIELQKRLNAHEARIRELETRPVQAQLEASSTGDTDTVEHDQTDLLSPTDDTGSPEALHLRPNLDTIELASPISTLRSLGAVDGNRNSAFHFCDPVSRGAISLNEVQEAMQIYFDFCHPWAPVLDEGLRHTGVNLRQSCPALFIAIVSIGARFWKHDSMHPNYLIIVALQDKLIAQLLLHPTPRDADIGTVRALMLYLQWMPCDRKITATEPPQTKTRYNDMSAWTIFGLALRYAGLLNLENSALASFENPRAASVSQEDIANMRTWLNVITYDCNLTLTSGLSVSVDPLSTARILGGDFTHASAQDPGDLRYCALVELASIVQRAKPSEKTRKNGLPEITSIKKANLEIEDWERHWLQQLRFTHLQHLQLPFTSSRWYRVALNSSLLRPLLSPSTMSHSPGIDQLSTLGFLETSLTAASQILLSVTRQAPEFVWELRSQNRNSFPQDEFVVDPVARKSLHHSVDATWISFAFAMTFLVLSYIRNVIDDDVQILGLSTSHATTICAPTRPRQKSIIARLTRLAMDVFGVDPEVHGAHPGSAYRVVIRDAASAVLDCTRGEPSSLAQDPMHPAFQSLFEMLDDTMYDWPNLYTENTSAGHDLANLWNPQ